MTTSSRYIGKIHSPDEAVRAWNHSGKAYIFDRLSEPGYFTIQIANGNGISGLSIDRLNTLSRIRGTERFSLDWFVREFDTQSPEISLTQKTVEIAGIPPAGPQNQGREIRPYTDMLFLGGEIQITEVPETASNRLPIHFLGSVVNVMIVTESQTYSTWPLNFKG